MTKKPKTVRSGDLYEHRETGAVVVVERIDREMVRWTAIDTPISAIAKGLTSEGLFLRQFKLKRRQAA